MIYERYYMIKLWYSFGRKHLKGENAMDKNFDLYCFLSSKSKEISDKWYATIDEKDQNSVYASTDPNVIQGLRKQNLDFNYLLNRIFNGEVAYFYEEIKHWAKAIAEDKGHQKTPIHKVVREFTRVRNYYLLYINQFSCQYTEEISIEQMEEWKKRVIDAFDYSINLFIEETFLTSERHIHAQKQIITELSSPVISLYDGAALLPLIGDIDTERAKFIMESTLQQCMDKHVNYLFLDLSGVLIIDTMVAHQLSQLMTALKLIGVTTTISGIRPEIAQTSVQLGISFEEGTIKSTLAQAISDNVARRE